MQGERSSRLRTVFSTKHSTQARHGIDMTYDMTWHLYMTWHMALPQGNTYPNNILSSRTHNRAHMNENDSSGANIFLLILSSVFVACISLLITSCSDKIKSDHIVTYVQSESPALILSNSLVLILLLVWKTFNHFLKFPWINPSVILLFNTE